MARVDISGEGNFAIIDWGLLGAVTNCTRVTIDRIPVPSANRITLKPFTVKPSTSLSQVAVTVISGWINSFHPDFFLTGCELREMLSCQKFIDMFHHFSVHLGWST